MCRDPWALRERVVPAIWPTTVRFRGIVGGPKSSQHRPNVGSKNRSRQEKELPRDVEKHIKKEGSGDGARRHPIRPGGGKRSLGGLLQ